MDQQPNFQVVDNLNSDQIRQQAIKALQEGHDFILILALPPGESDQPPTIHTSTTLSSAAAGFCINVLARQIRHIRPGMNN